MQCVLRSVLCLQSAVYGVYGVSHVSCDVVHACVVHALSDATAVLQLDRTQEELDLLAFEARQALLYYQFQRMAFADVLKKGEGAVSELQGQVAELVVAMQVQDLDASGVSLDCMHLLAVEEANLFVLQQVDVRVEVMHSRAIALFVAIL